MLRSRGPRLVHQRFEADELVAVLLEDGAGERTAADPKISAVLLQLLDEPDEVAVSVDDGKGVDVLMRKRHLQCVEGEVDVGAVLVSARRRDTLYHVYGVLRHLPLGAFLTAPIRVSELGHDVAAFL